MGIPPVYHGSPTCIPHLSQQSRCHPTHRAVENQPVARAGGLRLAPGTPTARSNPTRGQYKLWVALLCPMGAPPPSPPHSSLVGAPLVCHAYPTCVPWVSHVGPTCAPHSTRHPYPTNQAHSRHPPGPCYPHTNLNIAILLVRCFQPH